MKFGITNEFECSYLPDLKERLLVCVEPAHKLSDGYDQLSALGFRRSGDQIYRPHCANCRKCHSLRVISKHFRASKSQRRILNKNKELTVKVNNHNSENYYPLFERYINELHQDGSMYPTSINQYMSFVDCEWSSPIFLEAWLQEKLLAVAVTDQLKNGLSALYTFYDPDEYQRSLGTFMIMKQIDLCTLYNKEYLYLGYQIDECKKMNYKTKFIPYERFIGEKWYLFRK